MQIPSAKKRGLEEVEDEEQEKGEVGRCWSISRGNVNRTVLEDDDRNSESETLRDICHLARWITELASLSALLQPGQKRSLIGWESLRKDNNNKTTLSTTDPRCATTHHSCWTWPLVAGLLHCWGTSSPHSQRGWTINCYTIQLTIWQRLFLPTFPLQDEALHGRSKLVKLLGSLLLLLVLLLHLAPLESATWIAVQLLRQRLQVVDLACKPLH